MAKSASMKKKKRKPQSARRQPGNVSRTGDQTLTSYRVGALPILNRIIARAKIEEFLREYLEEDKRCTIPPSIGIVVLLKNYLVSREPIYGVSGWAQQQVPKLLGLSPRQVASLNDDRVGRCLDRLFDADRSSLLFSILAYIVKEFGVHLDELHNDSTTITFFGAYENASKESTRRGKETRAITFGHNKDHRPDLKQLLFILTASADGAVPVQFNVGNGNLNDEKTHITTWELVSKLRGTVDFMYVADSKLATKENMAHIASRGGRFISVLPRTRAEDKAFRELQHEGRIEWLEIHNKRDERGEVADVYSVATETSATAEGYRLLWFHSTRKDDLDSASRSKKIDRALDSLIELRQKLRSPRTRYTQEPKVREEVAKRLAEHGAERWFTVHIDKFEQEDFKQERRGRPGKNMRYVRQVKTRFDILWELNAENIAADARQDGIFPLVTNDQELPIEEVLLTYKRQPLIEKRFSQLKTDYAVAPIFLKSVARIEALLTIYFLALVVQALLERELRRAMKKQRVHSLPLYAEERDCRAPTTRKVIDTFENVHSHKLTHGESDDPTYFVTELSPLQTDILSLLRVPPSDYSSIC